MSFLDSLETTTNRTARTANGALSNESTLDYVLDFFSQAGAMRGKERQAYDLFMKAYAQDRNLALKTLFYLRDIRGGQGERSVFNYIIRELNKTDPNLTRRIVHLIPEYGRWDETLNILDGHDIELAELLGKQLIKDHDAMKAGEPVSLLAKWLPSVKTSSKETRRNAVRVAELLGLKIRVYRKMLSELRAYINILERDMTSRNWSGIDYSKLPSLAHKKHVKAFYRHDEDRYKAYLESVKKGDAKINAGTLMTYEIYDMLLQRGFWSQPSPNDIASANAFWNALPDYTNGDNAIVLADVSGSMNGRPMSVSVSLALYFADRNKGTFKDYFMTFTDQSRLQKVVGNNLYEKMKCIQSADWHGSTNLQSAFDAILTAAKTDNTPANEMPKVLYIISDMQFNVATHGNTETNFEVAKRKFNEAGYELPHLVFWNVNAYGDSPATKFEKNVTLISGFNQSTFKYAVAGKTPIDSMLEVLNSERYKAVEIE